MAQKMGGGRARSMLSAALLATAAVGPLMMAPAAHAQAADERSFDIPAQPLADALVTFGIQSGLQVTTNGVPLRGVQTAGVRGSLPPAQALSQLLSGTGFTFRISGNVVTLEPAPQSADGAIELGPVRVEGATNSSASAGWSSDPAATEGTGSYAAQAVTIGKVPQSLKDIPQSVTVMTRQLIDDQRLDTIGDLMIRAPGVILATDENNADKFYSRGFEVSNIQLDGASIAYNGYKPNTDLAIYDRVEILRGSDGLFSGTGQPGGTVNLVRKRPLMSPKFDFAASVGSWENYRIEADATGPIGFGGKLRARAVGMYQNRDFFYSPSDEEKILLYGIIEGDIGPDTTLSAGASYQKQKGATWYSGLPRYQDGSDLDLPRNLALTTDWAIRDQTTKEYFGDLEHKFGLDWTLKVKASRQEHERRQDMFLLRGSVSLDSSILTDIAPGRTYAGNSATTIDANLSGSFSLFGRRHQIVFGADWQKSQGIDMRRYWEWDGAPQSVDIFEFDPSAFPPATIGEMRGGWPKYGARQFGIYGKVQAEITEGFRFIFGGRFSDFKYTSPYENYDTNGTLISSTLTKYREKGIFTPYGALVYSIDQNWSAYASIAEIHQPQAGMLRGPLPGDPLSAITGRSYEAGVKGSLREEALNLSFALYRIERNGEAVFDSNYGYSAGEYGSACCYIARGKVVSQGVDTEITGNIVDGWKIQIGYTYNHNRDKEEGIPFHAMTPEHLFKLWSSYTLPDRLDAWTIGFGVTAQSKQANTGTMWVNDPITGWDEVPYRIDQKGYAVAHASIDYRFNDGWSLALNLKNIFDKRYYQTIGTVDYGNWYGEPRSFAVTLRGGF